jgi:hypothetical protein
LRDRNGHHAVALRLLRNRVAHNDAQPNLSDLDTALANVNMCVRIVGDFRTTDPATADP